MELAVDQANHIRDGLRSLRVSELGIRPVTNLGQDAARLTNWRHGRIVTQSGRLVGIYGRWWPHLGNWMQVIWDMHVRSVRGDRCELFYHQPLGNPGYLSLSYVHSGARTSLSTVYLAGLVLDEIARLHRAHAIVCHVTNDRITDRLMQRLGWQAHCQQWSGRHFIKRFYGEYPDLSPHWRQRLMNDNQHTQLELTSNSSC